MAEWSGVDNAEKYLVKTPRGSQFIVSEKLLELISDFRSAITQNETTKLQDQEPMLTVLLCGDLSKLRRTGDERASSSSRLSGTENGR